jgi:F-type H+-transporting ATPase subunit epsilon
MALTIHCDIVSAEAQIFSGLVELLVASGSSGEMGVTYGHTPLLTDLTPGNRSALSFRVAKRRFTSSLVVI